MNQVLARGRMAEVLEWGEGRVLKLYFPEFPFEDALHEARVTAAAHSAGAGAPESHEVIEREGRPGIVFDRIDGETMLERIWRLSTYEVLADAVTMANLHRMMHIVPTVAITDIPLQRDKLERRIGAASALTAHVRERLIELQASLSDGRALCHGDFHPGNILVSASRAVAIDWIDASLGDPLADVARTRLLFETGMRRLQDSDQRRRAGLFAKTYLETYASEDPVVLNIIQRWLPIVAAARLAEGIDEEEEDLVALAIEGLERLE